MTLNQKAAERMDRIVQVLSGSGTAHMTSWNYSGALAYLDALRDFDIIDDATYGRWRGMITDALTLAKARLEAKA